MWKRPADVLVRHGNVASRRAVAVRAGWINWGTSSTHHRVLAASALLLGLASIAKLATAGREVATAYWFGTGSAVDAFVVAMTVPTFAIVVVANAAGSALLPTLTHVHQTVGRSAAVQLLRDTTFWCLALLCGTYLLLAFTSAWWLKLVSPGLDAGTQALAMRMVFWLLPAIAFRGLVSIWSSVLHSQKRFAATGLAPAITPLVAVLCLFALADRTGIEALAIGVTAGSIVEAAVLGWTVRSCGFPLLPIPGRPSTHLGHICRQYLPLMAAAALMGSTTLVDNAMASQLGPGGVSTLNFGRKLVALAISIPTVSISRAVYPYFSQLAAERKWTEVHAVLAKSRALVLLGMIPITLALILLARPLTTLLLQHGAFGASSTESVAWVQVMYACQIPFYTLSIIYVRLISSLRLNYLLTASTVISILLNVLLNYVLMRPMGVAGIALSTSLVYATACIFLLVVTHRALQTGRTTQ